MGLVNSAANLVNRPTNGSASQNMASNSTYSDRGRYSGSGKCIERQLNIFEVISIIFAGGFCIGQAGILGGRSGRNDSCKPADLANDSEHFYNQSVVNKDRGDTGAGIWSRLDYDLKSVCLNIRKDSSSK